MKKIHLLLFIGFLFTIYSFNQNGNTSSNILSYQVNLKTKELKMYWKDGFGNNYLNFDNLGSDLKQNKQKLIFAMNGGMYLKDHSPKGFFIENGISKKKMNTVQNAYGNFYMQPNGIFYITQENEAVVVSLSEYNSSSDIKYTTQSVPMLLINGKMHTQFIKGSKNLYIRNGVGILSNGNVLFAISKERINFYDFATFFKNKGCKNASYLDGFVSRVYLPEQNWEQLDGDFGVIIGVTEKL